MWVGVCHSMQIENNNCLQGDGMKKNNVIFVLIVFVAIVWIVINTAIDHETSPWDKRDETFVYFPTDTDVFLYIGFGTTPNEGEKFEAYVFTPTKMVKLVEYFKYPGADRGDWKFGNRTKGKVFTPHQLINRFNNWFFGQIMKMIYKVFLYVVQRL